MTNHTAWMVKFVLNLVFLTFFDLCKAVASKGQLILKCLFGVLIWTKIATKYCQDFCRKIFCSFLEASWALVGLPWDLVSNIINKEAYTHCSKF